MGPESALLLIVVTDGRILLSTPDKHCRLIILD